MATGTVTKKLAAMQIGIASLAGPLYSFLTCKSTTGAASTAWNARVLELVVGTLERGTKLADLYATIQETLPSKVAAVGLDAGQNPEQLEKLRDQAHNTVSQLNGPFWAIARVVLEDGSDSILALANGEDATWSAVKRFAKDRVEDLAFDPSRGNVNVTYVPRGTDHAVTFTVEQAAKTRDQYQAAMAQAETIKADNSPNWGAVMRSYREENPCEMTDRRTRADRDKEATELGRAILNKVSSEKIAALLK